VPTRFPVIAGPTAGGKSDLAVELALLLAAREAPGEIISADSIQIYRALDVGSAKPTQEERRGVPHHLIDIVQPDQPFTVSDWLSAANRLVAEIQSRNHTPIVVGGTHLYIKAFLDGLFEGPAPVPALREELRAHGLPALRAELQRVDPAAAARIHPADERRTIRALEVFRQTGKPISAHQQQWDKAGGAGGRTDCTLVILDWPPELLNPRINARVKHMMTRGLLDETRSLVQSGRLGPQSREALGYKQLIAHLEGRASLDEAVEQIKIETRRFAKNQRTWLRRLRTTPGAIPINVADIQPKEWARTILDARA
jgi:tRNA dimethylallyltransferase